MRLEERLHLWLSVLQQDAARAKRNPALLKSAVDGLVAWSRQMAAPENKGGIFVSSMLVRGFFRHGYDAEAREVARVALQRGVGGGIRVMEAADTMSTAKLMLDHSAAGTPDRALVQQFLDSTVRISTHPQNDMADALYLAASGLLDTSLEVLKAKPGDEGRVASIWAQKRGVADTLAWVNEIKDASSRSRALAAIAAVLADDRDKQLSEPIYRWVDNRITEIERPETMTGSHD
jgi:hypothetical protein